MSSLKCKNCGGSIHLDEKTQQLTCDSCGISQKLDNLVDTAIFDNAGIPTQKFKAYQRGIELLKMGESEITLFSAAEEFRTAQDLFNAAQLAEECTARGELLRQERLYIQATTLSKSADIEELQTAIDIFKDLENYKKSAILLAATKEQLDKVLEDEQLWYEQQIQEKKKKTRRKKMSKILIFFVAVLAIGIFLVLTWLPKLPSNINVKITPDTATYMTKEFNTYVFHYNVELTNNSALDLSGIEAEVYFETEEGKILVDTTFNAGTTIYKSTPIVRGKKSRNFSWSITMSSEKNATALYQQNFEDLEVTVKITELKFNNEILWLN